MRDWQLWARDKQLAPSWGWVIWLILAGRGFGKTRTGAEWIRRRVETGKARRIILAGPTSDDLRDVMIEGESGLLAVSSPTCMPVYVANKGRVVWPNGAMALCITAEKPDRFRGKQCFVAGTLVDIGEGRRPIESVGVGDAVLTRYGLCRVSATATRLSEVGRVKFSDGSELVGTADHPVFSEGSWLPLASLSIGSKIFSGTSVLTDTSSDTLWGASTSSTESSGNGTTDQSQTVARSTTRTATERTTVSTTSNASSHASTTTGMFLRAYQSISCAPCAAKRSLAAARSSPRESVADVSRSEQTTTDGLSASASTAARRSCPGKATTAVSVASTWERVGVRRVFNLTVERHHEYFANGILVHNCDTFWGDELASWRYSDAWTQLQLGFRLGSQPQGIVTTTPRPIPLVKELLAREGTDVAVTRGTTYENRDNLAKAFFDQVIRQYEGTRLGRQELDAEVLEDNPGALWKRTRIDELRVDEAPELRRIVVAVDPAVSANPKSNETGIVAVGVGVDGHWYVLDDKSGVYQPAEWASRVVALYDHIRADRVIGETNNGGDLVESNVRTARQTIPYEGVHASRGKQTRAEPISALYEQGRVHHVGVIPKLEDQMCSWDPANDEGSPDRVDALVWAVTYLAGRSEAPNVKPKQPTRGSVLDGDSSW